MLLQLHIKLRVPTRSFKALHFRPDIAQNRLGSSRIANLTEKTLNYCTQQNSWRSKLWEHTAYKAVGVSNYKLLKASRDRNFPSTICQNNRESLNVQSFGGDSFLFFTLYSCMKTYDLYQTSFQIKLLFTRS